MFQTYSKCRYSVAAHTLPPRRVETEKRGTGQIFLQNKKSKGKKEDQNISRNAVPSSLHRDGEFQTSNRQIARNSL